MSTALIRDIRSALFDVGRPVPDDVTLTTGVRELIAAVSESEQDLERCRVELGTARLNLTSATRERDKALADVADLRATVDGLVTERTALIATANRRLYDAKGVAFFAGVAVATILEALIRMVQ